ncbi:phosphate transport system regulatory protein PhoU [Neobacillus notoginsengisoli]|uniref:Phosphate-specific transport system accessory protein PhoU n=1 Tax=Neobacillus notoginsengisoli TaxID=1578198 RepID=A0A417YUS1_9BACI|nr:phosphate signaling complex protein PhoU [Neobacillus notoginsengisoli]RHW41057.1 phosphate transport system regulatory protein PhoU [Neobacillus notoginsengisoli]
MKNLDGVKSLGTRTNFDSNLKSLNDMLMEMAGLATAAVEASVEALVSQNMEHAEKVIQSDKQIDDLELQINEKAILLIATESPVATDLRAIISVLKISSEVERIADNAVNIAKSAMHIGSEKHIKEIEDIPKMKDLALEMLDCSLKSLLQKDASLARKCAKIDDVVDEMYGRLVHELLEYIPANPGATNQITQMAFTCRYIERIGDHSTNIAEQVVYLVTGKQSELNS